ncbi:hypothetical protein NsoK4_05040 [Nitrosopumilus sp. K4]|uniref:hypothetical protein n=1 Tax=Nitrosopumilus sp. K4 TaxID=2795383 RepID=UPI001BA9CA39|nr:hypothetical protein [Nitrosopumilus sp. K4]QUC63838.1 hypothetical protein NsoK4_05040 [Nitrosopumilus sp. K4]
MKNAQCTRCTRRFHEKDIYTIQQLQYRKEPNYEWSKKFLETIIGEWDSLCEECVKHYSDISRKAWQKENR